MIPVVWYNQTAQPKYQASVTVLYSEMMDAMDESMDPMRRYYRETSILNHIEEINSRSLADDIYEALPESLISEFILPDPPEPDFNRERFLKAQIENSISASGVRNTDVIKISAETVSPLLSMQLANLAADILQARNQQQRMEEVGGVRDFIEEQLEIYKEQLLSSEQDLREFKESNRVTSLEQESSEILRRITDCEVMFNQTKTARTAAEQRLSTILGELEERKQELLPSMTNLSSPWLQGLKERLVSLQLQYTQLQVQEYPDDHPKMVQLKQDIDQTKVNLTEEITKLAPNDFIVDPLKQIDRYASEALALEIEIESLKSQENVCQMLLQDYEKKLEALPSKEFELANLMRSRTVNDKIYMMLMEKREEARIRQAEKTADMRILERAIVPQKPVSPNKPLNLALGVLFGTTLAIGLAFFTESLNTNLRSSEEIEQLTDWPVLAAVPNITKIKSLKQKARNGIAAEPDALRGQVSVLEPKSMTSEAFRVLRTNLQFQNSDRQTKVLMTTSMSAQEGKSTITTNLGITLTKLGMRVLIIDADLRRPTIHKIMAIEKEPGLGDVLTNHHKIVSEIAGTENEAKFNQASDSPVWSSMQKLKNYDKDVSVLEDNLHDFTDDNQENSTQNSEQTYKNYLNVSLIESIQATSTKNLKVLTAGKAVTEPYELLSSPSMKSLLEIVKSRYDFVLVDCPPLLLVPESMVISSLVDGVMLVISTNKNNKDMLKKVQNFLQKNSTAVVGTVLNKVDTREMYQDEDYYYFG
jgi:capsular exopolysaccharide synthesis family protein